MRKQLLTHFTIDTSRDWGAFASPSREFEMLGVVKRGAWDIGAFAREKSTGRYICVNGGNVYDLDQTEATKALADARAKGS